MNLHHASITALVLGSTLLLVTGCKKTSISTTNYKAAIDTYYTAHPSCLWSQPQKFPVQVAASDNSQDAPYAALADQGLLTRNNSEEKSPIASKQEISYDLSSKGHADWNPDATQPRYGNFCYGQRLVSSIDNSTPNNGQPGETTTITYRYTIMNTPDWATASETQNAFPKLKASIAGATASITLIDTDSGWKVKTPQPAASGSTEADSKIDQ